jgi:hypothetical protein
MLVHSSSSAEVPVNVRGSLEAAHDAINAFFLLYAIFEAEAKVWWVFNHRAFLEALCIGNLLGEQAKLEHGEAILAKDPLFVRAKADIGMPHFLTATFVRTFLTEFISSNDPYYATNGRRRTWI